MGKEKRLGSFAPWAFLVAQMIKNLPAKQETWVQSLGWEDPLEKGKATYSSILENSMESPWGHKELYATDLLSHTHTHTHTVLYEALFSDKTEAQKRLKSSN